MAAAVACLGALAVPVTAARAATVMIPGDPLQIYANDNGQLQVAFAGSATGEFAPSLLAPTDAGLNVGLTDAVEPTTFELHGFLGAPFTSESAPVVSGNGSATSPWTLTTIYRTGSVGSNPNIRVTQTLTYVNGSTDVGAQYVVENNSDTQALRVRVYEAGNLNVAGNDSGVGLLDLGNPRQVGGINQSAGGSGRLIELSTWQGYQEANYNDLVNVIRTAGPLAAGLSNTVEPTLVDNGAGVQWDITNLPNGQSQTFRVIWRFTRFSALDLGPSTPAQVTGKTATVTATARNADGGPDPGRTVLYAITGANPGAGGVTTGGDGTAAISWLGKNAGTDTFSAFTDINGNGVRDANEPERTATVTWSAAPPPPPPPPPVPGKSVVVKVVSGQVFIKLPGSGRGARATGPPKGFVPFTGAANIPVGSQLDTSNGRVALTSAADTGGVKVQTSDFYQGIFQVNQTVPMKKPKKPTALITDVVMKGEISRSQCAPLKGARAASASAAKKKKGPKAVLGKLWGSGKGKFRTGGKYSSATVRGTIWLVEDRCEGTFTKVRRGTVQVRDLRRKKTVMVKAGHTYLARAQRVATKSRRGG
ncbi:MAG: hypothetical protein ACXVFK_19360 [Solirubrobacteraceae bacterium]